ncbi:solute carrier organic anion transporter family member 4A1-like isoform X1 [Acipenser ruthenus]|uniref:solute carrier organic anion transporter family member 4A1-like isoform X1 n=1 Tax=Acipenser ruthenus TaxID=7906 RepID=UPI0027415DE3|nr:solute carrier organic anion transporter family member 4A1-like isoform X1 [Acipenser ruthenus]XP_058859973.1 solute carrier organic anion transporter family member 4A1-like isoform X1 [Acipenser ruthenus]XP_058859975.1 solute carrier organic anion transporter family member 4A1-like isoform X1 [Acipenser ruthenus]XP_058859976.1 solute carrier organic anion transporter family member 4A1-like isoform X1 [Acipenser ruthenus]XP_058859977.1 solute carrier organic anion transporter family member 4
MPHLLTTDDSFSSKQELLDLNDSPEKVAGLSLETPSLEESPGGSTDSGALDFDLPSPTIDTSQTKIFLNGKLESQHGEDDPRGIRFVPKETEDLCGWGALKPRCIQVFNTPKWVLFFLCVASFLQGMIINGFINTVITSIERRFDLRSYQSGLIASSYDIACCICLSFVSYFGGTGHKPKWLGWGVVVIAIGSLVFALPHFTTESYKATMSEQTGLCSANQTAPCKESTSSLSNYMYVFMLGQFLHGIGATPLYTLGVTYLDENVKSSYAPVYIGIFYTSAIIGPAAGYLLGGLFLNMFTEFHETTLTPEDPLWVGAWWIGFLGGGAAALLVALPILGYPRQLPGSQRYVAMRVSEAYKIKDSSQETDPQFGKSIKDMPRSMLLLLKNPTFIFLCLAGATEANLVAGVSTFGPKFLESQFNLSASEAATMFGYMVVPAGGGGTFMGGYIIKKLNLRCGGIIKFCLLCAVVSLLAIFIFLIHCPNVPMAGVTDPYLGGPASDGPLNLTAFCNSECNCVREFYNPVCGDDGYMYYSPCHAGCSTVDQTLSQAGKKVYYDCSCVFRNLSSVPGGAVSGKCSSSCEQMPVFMVFFFVVMLFTLLSSIPALTATLRCVPDKQKSFALGIQWIIIRALGAIPGPITFGSVIDNSCMLWQDQCGEQGSCYLYENSTMGVYTLTAGVIYKVLGSFFFFMALMLYKHPGSPPSSSGNTDNGEAGESDPPVKDIPPEMLCSINTKL